MARPRKEIDKEQFEKLCALQCSQEEFLDWFEVSDKTLNAWCRRTYKMSFSEVFAQKRGRGKISLRRHQFELSKRNAAMAIFLGKNWLGQTDKVAGTMTIQGEIKNNVQGELQQHHDGAVTMTELPIDLTKLTGEELDDFERLCTKIQQPPPDG